MSMRWIGTLLLLTGFVIGQTPQAALSQPDLSPDGSQLAFAAGGAIWTVAAKGGAARLLLSDPATESRPLYSPDGKWLALVSTRTGNGDIYLLELATGALRRLTWDDGLDALDSWSPDSQWIYFSSTSHNIGGMNDIYRIRPGGGSPMIVTSERYVNEFYAAPAPDGSVTFCARGLASAQWWRKGDAHIDETELWSVAPATGQYTKLVGDGAKQIWPMWTPDGRTLYYMSDRGGTENLWAMAKGKAPEAVTHFTDGRVLWPTMAADGRGIAFERDFKIWTYDVKTGRTAPVAIRLEGAAAGPSVSEETTSMVEGMAVSPDGKKIAYTAHGEVFVISAEAGGAGLRLTRTGRLQFDLHWSPDSRRLAYISDRDGHDHVYEYDFEAQRERQLTSGATDECHLAYSPDGKWLAFQRGITDVVALDRSGDAGTERVLAHGFFGRPPLDRGGSFAWSPDSQYLAYLSQGDGLFDNAYVVALAGGPSQAVSFLPNANSGSLEWSPDAKYLLLQTSQRTEATRIARVDLIVHPPLLREDEFQSLFKSGGQEGEEHGRGGRGASAPPPPPATHIAFDGIAERMSLLPMMDARNPRLSPDGKWLAYIASDGASAGAEGGRGGNIYLYSMDEAARLNSPRAEAPKQLTSSAGGKQDLQFTADSKEIYFLEGGHINHVAVAGGPARAVNTSAELEVDFNQQKEEVFDEAWRYLRDNYMNPAMNGVNWDEVRTRYAPVVAGARTPDDLRLVLSEMIGELNSSHSGIAGGGARHSSTGRLGLFFDRAKYETGGKLCVTEVVPLSPAALADVRVGDCITSVNGSPTGAGINFDELMEDTIGHKLTLELARGDATTTAVMEPVNAATAKNLIYLAWVEHNRREVDQLSHGTLGYVHMIDMSQAALDKLVLDLDAANFTRKGVVIDVRNNNGGFVNAYALDVLAREPYLTMVPRGFPSGPARVALGQRALEKPTVLITNQNTLSDSEDFTEGYRAMKLGSVVGVPTAGWIIFTSNVNLIDGSSLRLPSTRILDHNGKDMELHPRPVDVEVQNPIGSWAAGRDAQLETAVRVLMGQISDKQSDKR